MSSAYVEIYRRVQTSPPSTGCLSMQWRSGRADGGTFGGPMFWAERHGLDRIVALMKDLAQRLSPRYRTAPLLKRLAASGKGWQI